MSDDVTVWFETMNYDDKLGITVVGLVETTWLNRYPCPIETMYDQGSEFIVHEFIKLLIQE